MGKARPSADGLGPRLAPNTIDNLEVGRLREESAAKQGEKRERDASRAAGGARGEQIVVAGWDGGSVQ